jgi:uncharacterized membrane protein
MRTKAVKWPKVFYVDGITPCTSGVEPREKLLEFLTQHQVPWRTGLWTTGYLGEAGEINTVLAFGPSIIWGLIMGFRRWQYLEGEKQDHRPAPAS